MATIHHGIDMHEFEPGEGPGDYLLFFGRIHPEKGTLEAIDVAEKAGLPLIIAGIIQDHEYFERSVEPRLDGERVSYLGPVGPDRRGELLAGARALLHLVTFDEPFGFSVVEAMACGTPVIARPRGSMPEIVRDGENGFLVGSLDEAVVGVRAAASMDRTPCVPRSSVASTPTAWLTNTSRSMSASRRWTKHDARAASSDPHPSGERFRLGVNYWPARTAMGWWSDFDRAAVADDFARIASSGLDSIRLFLMWADFQPAPDEVDRRMLDRLIAVADLAVGAGLAVVPTLFTGHMSGVNWIPAWALGGADRDDRFRVVTNGRVDGGGLRNWYSDPLVARAQALLATEAAGALGGHEAVWMWDLGNENSNCVIPPTNSSARRWLRRIASAIRTADPDARRHGRLAHGRPGERSRARAT